MVRQQRTVNRAFYVSTIATWCQNKAAALLIAIHTPIRNGMRTGAIAAGVTVYQKSGVRLSRGGAQLEGALLIVAKLARKLDRNGLRSDRKPNAS
jgi:hypothetical protein